MRETAANQPQCQPRRAGLEKAAKSQRYKCQKWGHYAPTACNCQNSQPNFTNYWMNCRNVFIPKRQGDLYTLSTPNEDRTYERYLGSTGMH